MFQYLPLVELANNTNTLETALKEKYEGLRQEIPLKRKTQLAEIRKVIAEQKGENANQIVTGTYLHQKSTFPLKEKWGVYYTNIDRTIGVTKTNLLDTKTEQAARDAYYAAYPDKNPKNKKQVANTEVKEEKVATKKGWLPSFSLHAKKPVSSQVPAQPEPSVVPQSSPSLTRKGN